jgi:hypothetical protein
MLVQFSCKHRLTLCDLVVIHGDYYEDDIALKCHTMHIGRQAPTFEKESSTMKTEAADISETLLCFCRITRCHISQQGTLH